MMTMTIMITLLITTVIGGVPVKLGLSTMGMHGDLRITITTTTTTDINLDNIDDATTPTTTTTNNITIDNIDNMILMIL